MKFSPCFFFILFCFLNLSTEDFTASLTNGIIGQFSHLYTHECLIYDQANSISIGFGSCLLSNNNNLFQLYYYDTTVSNFYIVSYPQGSSAQNILYQSSNNLYWTGSSNYCLVSPCYYYYSWPGDNYKFSANFSRGTSNNPLGTFTLKNVYNGLCIS